MNRLQKNDKTEDKKSKRTCQKNKRGDTKGDSNDSPEISDRVKSVCGGDIPGPPLEGRLPKIRDIVYCNSESGMCL